MKAMLSEFQQSILLKMDEKDAKVHKRLDLLEQGTPAKHKTVKPPAGRARTRGDAKKTPEGDRDAFEVLKDKRQKKVKRHLRVELSEEDSDSSEDEHRRHKKSSKQSLKSGLVRVDEAAAKVLVPWPHEAVFNLDTGSRPSPYNLTIAEFVYGFTVQSQQTDPSIAGHRTQILLDLMDDAMAFKWDKVVRGHVVLLQKLEMGTLTWGDKEGRDELRRKLVWPHLLPAPAFKKPAHGKDSSIPPCSFCMKVKGKAYHHKLADCMRKEAAEAASSAQGN